MQHEALLRAFEAQFGRQPMANLRHFYAPGRVNLIGEHIDYNGGFVFPCAIDRGTHLIVCPRQDRKIRAYSGNFAENGVIEASLDQTEFDAARQWLNYPMGVVHTLAAAGYTLEQGFDAYFFGTIPNGSGLSSSASIELVTAVMLNALGNFGLENKRLAVLCQRSENTYNGLNCGIMDQFSSAMGKQDHAILLNCDTLAYDYVPFNLENYQIVIINSNKKHSLVDSGYNDRRESCEIALAAFRTIKPYPHLVDVTLADWQANQAALPNDRVARRAKHVITEQERVIEAVQALKSGDLLRFGELMKASHVSLRDDFEVTGKELDTLAELAWAFAGVIGARMTGGGFGGCTVNLVERSKVNAFIEYIKAEYPRRIGLPADCYVVAVADGAQELLLSADNLDVEVANG